MSESTFKEIIQRAAEETKKREHERLIDMQVDIQARLFDKAATYNNIIVSLGYAGFLTVWTWARDFLDPWDATFIGLLLGTSLFVFVLWNVITTFLVSRQNIGMSKILSKEHLSPSERINDIVAFEKKIQRSALAYYATWYVVFLITATTGFIAGAILILMIGLSLVEASFTLSSLLGVGINARP